MSNERQALQEIEADLRLSPRYVLYLEGKTDTEMLLALLGASASLAGGRGLIHDQVLIVGLDGEGKLGRAPGSGSSKVRRLVELAQSKGYPNIFGILDGDGRDLATLAGLFDPPFVGPLFSWKGYCLENLIAQVAWPLQWGTTPAWASDLEVYTPYVALNGIQRELSGALKTLRLAKYHNPHHNEPRLDEKDALDDLNKDKHLLLGFDVARKYEEYRDEFRAALRRSTEEAHCLLNGKWLFNDLAPRLSGASPDACRTEWLVAVKNAGGLTSVRDFWVRLFP